MKLRSRKINEVEEKSSRKNNEVELRRRRIMKLRRIRMMKLRKRVMMMKISVANVERNTRQIAVKTTFGLVVMFVTGGFVVVAKDSLHSRHQMCIFVKLVVTVNFFSYLLIQLYMKQLS